MQKLTIIILIIIFLVSGPCARAEGGKVDLSEISLPSASERKLFIAPRSSPVLNASLEFNDYLEQKEPSIKLDPHHKVLFGRTSSDVDIKLLGQRGFIDYSAGISGLDKIGGEASVNLLHTLPELGRLDMGGGIFTNRLAVEDASQQENTYSIFTGYRFKRFSTKGKFVRKDLTYADNQYSDSWYVTNRFNLTKNISLKAGYQEHEATKSEVKDFGIEYSLDAIKFEIDTSLIRYQENESRNSQRFGIKTKYFF